MNDLPGADPNWAHELRNAVNAIALSAAVVRGLLECGEHVRSLEFLDELDRACDRCRKLVTHLPNRHPAD